jgi:hypothetical protein
MVTNTGCDCVANLKSTGQNCTATPDGHVNSVAINEYQISLSQTCCHFALIEHQESDIIETDIAGLHSLTMLDFLVGWVELAKSGLLAKNLVSPPDYIRIAESLNPTSNLTLSR